MDLELANRSDFTVWLEDAKLIITNLEANFQTGLAKGRTVHPIKQAVPPDESLSMSLAGSFYEAAGRPQGPYSFVVSGTIHYRIDDEWAEANIRPYRVEMTALSIRRLRRKKEQHVSESPRRP